MFKVHGFLKPRLPVDSETTHNQYNAIRALLHMLCMKCYAKAIDDIKRITSAEVVEDKYGQNCGDTKDILKINSAK